MSIHDRPSIDGPRRTNVGRQLVLGPVRLNLDRFSAHANGSELSLTRLEFDLLAYLMRNACRVVAQEEIVRQVVRGVYRGESSLVRVHVAHLRRKLGRVAFVIQTVRGRGFLFRGEVIGVGVVGARPPVVTKEGSGHGAPLGNGHNE